MKKNKNSAQKKKLVVKPVFIIASILVAILAVSAYPTYLLGQYFFNKYFDDWGNKLVALEKRGLLSKQFGAAWQDIINEDAMEHAANKLLGTNTAANHDTARFVDGVSVNEYPSLSIIARLNAVQNYSNEIRIVDRKDRDIARIRTNHQRAKIAEFPPTLIKAIVAAEDNTFWTNKIGVEYGSIVRSVFSGLWHDVATFSFHAPRGTSTITQQVAKLFISDIDAAGHRRASKTMDRKLREMRLASAMRKMYKPEEILEVYVNHCITSDNGLIGCKDIARALFDKDLHDLSDAQCVYLARSVKWGRNVKAKIMRQCAIDMPRIAKAMNWNRQKQKKVLEEIQGLSFKKLRQIQTDFGPLVDCANEFWLSTLQKNGASPQQCLDMDIVDPNSLIRKKGNLIIRLTIDIPLQRELERLVNGRGYGPDSIAMIHGKPILVSGQYFAYAIMDSKSGKLLAYYSKDRIGSRMAGLLKNRTPNGSSTAKPIFNALMFDCGIFPAFAKWNDSLPVTADLPWQRTLKYEKSKLSGVLFSHSAVRGRTYEVHNHGDVFEGCQYIFDQLNASNNILAVETVYRLNQKLFNLDGSVTKEAFPLVQLFYRIGAFDRIKDELGLTSVTGVRVYKELARIVGVNVDSTESGTRRAPLSDSLYSVALGTLELTLYEQMHLFNVLYDNDLIEKPAEHQSLVVDNIVLNGDTVSLNDTIKRCHPFCDIQNLRPTYLGLHKRLVGTDALEAYDIPLAPDSSGKEMSNSFDANAMQLEGQASYFAKSGTTDDVLKPFNATLKSGKKTNYGLWNAVIRLDLSKLSGAAEPEIRDVTISCIGEGNEKFTGPRDGKTLHKFLTKGLMLHAGVQAQNGFFGRYEQYIKRTTPKDIADCQGTAFENGTIKSSNPFEKFMSIFKKKPEETKEEPHIQNAGEISKDQD